MLYFVIEHILISFGGMHNYRGIIYSPIPKQKKIDNKGNVKMFKNALRIPSQSHAIYGNWKTRMTNAPKKGKQKLKFMSSEYNRILT
jgi:hypothetical protein